MVGDTPSPGWLETDWLLSQFGRRRPTARVRYAGFVADGIGRARIWEEPRHPVFLRDDSFLEKHRDLLNDVDRLREIPRAQRRALTKSLAYYAEQFKDPRDAINGAFRTGVYSMQEIAEYFGVHYSTVSRIVRRFAGNASHGKRLP